MRALVALFVVAAACVAALVGVAWAVLPFDRISVAVDGTTYPLGDLQGWQLAGAFAAAVVAIVLALAVALAAVVLATAVGAIGLAIGALAAVASAAVVVGPVVLVAWLLWRFARRQRPAASVAAR
jgi:hypothetical protein